jgi:hypothetical protein
MVFRNPLLGNYQIVDFPFLKERSIQITDPRHQYYKAILSSISFEQYYDKVGDLVVNPKTTSYEVNADMEIKYAVRQRWIAKNVQEQDTTDPSTLSCLKLRIP